MFSPGRTGHSSTLKKKQRTPTWTGTFFVFSDKQVEKPPTSTQKALLQNAGLGQKKVQMLVTDDSETVKQKLIEEFPKLKECGGFEFLRCMPNCRNLKILECNWDASSLRSAVGSQAKIYVRPIQRNLPIEVNHNQPTEDLCEKCNGCSQMINIRLLREHLQNCVSETTDVVHLNDGTINTTYISSIPRDEPTMEQPTTSHVPRLYCYQKPV